MAVNPKGRKLDKSGAPIVSKKELDDSGMSLRDFLNKERGLTRRTSNADLEPPNVDAEAGMSRGTRRSAPVNMTEVAKPGTRTNYENTEATSETFKRGGKVASRGDGIAQRGKTRGRVI